MSTVRRCPLTLLAMLTLVVLIGSSTPAASSSEAPGSEPPLRVPRAELEDAFVCDDRVEKMDQVALLVHGTSVTAEENWSWNYARALPRAGWAVCLITLPHRALDDIQVSSEYVVYAIREAAKAARDRIDVIGISQGGLEPRWALRWWPGLRNLVDDLVMIATPNHGATFADVSCVNDCIPALWQTREESEFLRVLNGSDETPGGISYTSIYSSTDWVIQPATTAELDGASNIAAQDVCPGRPVEHAQTVYDAVIYALAMDALRHPGPAEPSRVPATICGQVVMPYVDLTDVLQNHAQIYVTSVLVQSAYPKARAEPRLAGYTRPALLVEPPDGAGATAGSPAPVDLNLTPSPVGPHPTRTVPPPVATSATAVAAPPSRSTSAAETGMPSRSAVDVETSSRWVWLVAGAFGLAGALLAACLRRVRRSGARRRRPKALTRTVSTGMGAPPGRGSP